MAENISHADVVIIGAGPAGLTAATYLGRFLRKVVVLHSAESRAALIPTSHNYPGFPTGINGRELIARMLEQASGYGVALEQALVTGLTQTDNGFEAHHSSGSVVANGAILATGIVDNNPQISGLAGAIYDGQLRYCPICDGYEVTDKRVCVVGPASSALKKALFLRTYTRNVTLISAEEPSAQDRREAKAASVEIVQGDVDDVVRDDAVTVTLRDGRKIVVDTIYPALGCRPRSQLATKLGVNVDSIGAIEVDRNQETSVKRLYAIGDVVSEIDQISVGIGHAAIAATHIHNSLPTQMR